MGTVISNPEYFRTDSNLDLTSNVAINKELRITNTHASNTITITVSDTQTIDIPAGETQEIFFDGTQHIVLNEIGTSASIQQHISQNVTSTNTVHGIRQGSGNGFDADTVDGMQASVFATKVTSGVENNIATLDSDGNIQDSGTAATKSGIRTLIEVSDTVTDGNDDLTTENAVYDHVTSRLSNSLTKSNLRSIVETSDVATDGEDGLITSNGAFDAVQGHANENITSSNAVHGITQGTGNGFDADTVDGMEASVFATKVTGGTENNFATLDSDGDIKDSGLSTTLSISATSTDSQIPSAEAVREYVLASGGTETPDGDPLPSGDILFADGQIGPTTSDNALPIEDSDNYSYEPAKIDIAGELYDNPFVKFSSTRGMKGIFQSFTNLVNQSVSAWSTTGTATISQEGEWIVVNNNSTALSTANSNIFNLSGTSYLGMVRIRIRNSDATTTRVDFAQIGNVDITWGSSRSILFTSPSSDINSQFISDNIVELVFSIDSTAQANNIRVTADPNNANRTVWISRIQAVDFGNSEPQYLPYYNGFNLAGNLTYYHLWGQQGTIEFWADIQFDYDTSNFYGFFDSRIGNGTDNDRITFYYTPTDDRLELVYSVGSTQYTFTTAVYTGTSWLSRGFHHFKITYDVSASANNALYIDGSTTTAFAVTPTPSGTLSIDRRIQIGFLNFSSVTAHLNGFIDDIRWSPTVDATNTHYTLSKPYYQTNKTYRGEYGLDAEGNVSARSLTTVEPLSLDFELLWEGNTTSSPITFTVGFYIVHVAFSTATTGTISLPVYFNGIDRADSPRYGAFDGVYLLISAAGVGTLVGSGTFTAPAFRTIRRFLN